jgi:hypothetical protein
MFRLAQNPLGPRCGLVLLVLASLAFTGVLSAGPVPIKGKTGAILIIDIQQITSTGFTGTRQDNGQNVTVAWQHVDLDWLKTNQPDTYKSYTDALAAASAAPAADSPAASTSASADTASAVVPSTPADIAAQLLFSWRSTTANFLADPNSASLAFGTHTRDYRQSITFTPPTDDNGGGHNHQKGGHGGGPTPPPGPNPKETNLSLFRSFDTADKAASVAYSAFLDNKKLRDAMTGDVDSALAALQPLLKGKSSADAAVLIDSGQNFLQAMQDIVEKPDTMQHGALENIQAFIDAWKSVAANSKLPSSPTTN